MSDEVAVRTFHILSKHLSVIIVSLSLAIGLRSVELTQRGTDRVRPCPTESIRQHFTPSVNTSMYFLRLSRSDFFSVEPTQIETVRVRPCQTESIRQHFTPSVNTSMSFSKSLAIGLPLSRTDTERDGSCPPCPMESIRQNFTPSVNTSLSLAIGLTLSRTVVYLRRSDSVRVYWTCMKLRGRENVITQ